MKKLLALVLLLALVFTLPACAVIDGILGGGEQTTTTEPTTQEEPPTEEPTFRIFPYNAIVYPDEGLYIRSGAGKANKIVGSLRQGDVVTVKSETFIDSGDSTADGYGYWGEIGTDSWICLDFVVEAGTGETPPKRLTEAEAAALATELYEKAAEIINVWCSGLEPDKTKAPIVEDNYSYYPVAKNEYGISNLAGLEEYSLRAYTRECFRQRYWEGKLRYDLYMESDGQLYVLADRDVDFFYAYPYPETTKIVGQSGDTLVLEMKGTITESGMEDFIFWTLKYEGGAWKLDCDTSGQFFIM